MIITEKPFDSLRIRISPLRSLQLLKRWPVSYIHVEERWMDTGHTKPWRIMTQPFLLTTLLFVVKPTFNLNQPFSCHTLNTQDCGYMKEDSLNPLRCSLNGPNLTPKASRGLLSRLGKILEPRGQHWPACSWDAECSPSRMEDFV